MIDVQWILSQLLCFIHNVTHIEWFFFIVNNRNSSLDFSSLQYQSNFSNFSNTMHVLVSKFQHINCLQIDPPRHPVLPYPPSTTTTMPLPPLSIAIHSSQAPRRRPLNTTPWPTPDLAPCRSCSEPCDPGELLLALHVLPYRRVGRRQLRTGAPLGIDLVRAVRQRR